MSFEEVFGKTTFIEHLNEVQQGELYHTVEHHYLNKQKVKEAIEVAGFHRYEDMLALLQKLGL